MDHSGKPLIVPIFIPHFGCPHQCAFCNQAIITRTNTNCVDESLIHDTIRTYLQYKGKREQVELAFFGGNFLGLPPREILRLLKMVDPYVRKRVIDGIRFSTRPDTITSQTLDLIRPFKISAVELGVQSMNDDILKKSKRGHTSDDTIQAVTLLKKSSFKVGAQVMVGLPGDSEAILMESTRKVTDLFPDFVRIYPLMVLKGSQMEKWYQQGIYEPLTLGKSVRLVKKMALVFAAANIDVIRMGLQASDFMEDKSKVIAGPWHPAFGHLVFSSIMYDQACERIDNHLAFKTAGKIVLKVNPKSESRLRGDKNGNMKRLKKRYPKLNLSIARDDSTPINHLHIEGDSV